MPKNFPISLQGKMVTGSAFLVTLADPDHSQHEIVVQVILNSWVGYDYRKRAIELAKRWAAQFDNTARFTWVTQVVSGPVTNVIDPNLLADDREEE